MGEWKAQISIRVPVPLRYELDELAKQEHRTLSNLWGILLEYAMERLKAAGSMEKLLHRKEPIPRDPGGNYRRKQ
jgi:hypothetical protein